MKHVFYAFALCCSYGFVHGQATITVSQQASTKGFSIYAVTISSPIERKLSGATIQQAIESQGINIVSTTTANLLLQSVGVHSTLAKVVHWIGIAVTVGGVGVALSKSSLHLSTSAQTTLANDSAAVVVTATQLESALKSPTPTQTVTTIQTLLGQVLKPTETISAGPSAGWQGLLLGSSPLSQPKTITIP